MKRLEFFKSIFIGGLGIMIPGQIQVAIPKTTPPQSLSGSQGLVKLNSRQQIKLITSSVAGYQYYDGNLVEHELTAGMPLTLVREPKNRYDSNAIAIYYKSNKIGFIPMAENAILANMLDEGIMLETTVTAFNPEMPTWGRVEVEVGMMV